MKPIDDLLQKCSLTRRNFVSYLTALGVGTTLAGGLGSTRAMAAASPEDAVEGKPKKRIDVHHHIVPRTYVEAMNKAGYGTIGGVPFPKWEPETLERSFDVLGISKAIVSISAPGVAVPDVGAEKEIARHVNEYSAELMRDFGSRVGAFATIPMSSVDSAIAESTYALDTLGLNGVCLFSNHQGVYLGDAALDEYMDYLNQRDAIVFVHPTLPLKELLPPVSLDPPLVEFVFETTRAVSNMLYNGVLERDPRIRFVLAHLGGTMPFISWRMGLFEHSPRQEFVDFRARCPKPVKEYLAGLYYDIGVSCSEGNLRNVLSFIPEEHVLFGSDFPFAAQSFIDLNTRSLMESGVLNQAGLEKVNSTNAERLFGFTPA